MMVCALSLFSVGALALKEGRANVQWQYCEPMHAYPSNITFVKMEPYPPKAGDTITLTVGGKHEMQVHGGEISFDAFFHQVPLYHGTEDLCMRSKCPSNSNGFFKYRAQERLPSFTPPGPYHLRVKVNDDHGEELLCVKTRLHLMPAKI
eukprot:CAMPEP_0197479168 /NCGR_PEP_ID=MMETSP1309-20131121/32135_1 /TAXON_ID=464262 /ORGANISM="Genus nov. species nov., Strain RCC998" /LENGTH=148 /DNA_ID=CAMNT_0043020763 /DNA_START=214 /DNA_END=660 /DNA_ORIENTATION=+